MSFQISMRGEKGMKKIGILIILLVLISGCTGTQPDTTGPNTGTLTVITRIDDSTLEQGESTTIEVDITNLYSNDINNVRVTLEPVTTGIQYDVTGPDSVEANMTEGWSLDIDLSPGLNARTYNLYLVICFDYTQEQIGYFRVADGTPSITTVDSSLSNTGPISIIFSGLKSFDVNVDDKLDLEVRFSLGTNILGGVNLYEDESDLDFTSGVFILDAVGENLRLFTNENNLNAGTDNYCPIQTSGENQGFALCHFNVQAGNKASDDFDFDIRTSETLSSEVNPSFQQKSRTLTALRARQLRQVLQWWRIHEKTNTNTKFCIINSGLHCSESSAVRSFG